jgi:hypothetical protein
MNQEWTLHAIERDGSRILVTVAATDGSRRTFPFEADEEDGLVEVWSDAFTAFVGEAEAVPLFAAVHRFFIASRVPVRPE